MVRSATSPQPDHDVELRHFQQPSQPPAWDDDADDEDDERNVLNDDPQLRRASVQSFELYTPDEEKAVVRKLDVYVVAFMSFLYLLSFLDRTNIGNARIAGMQEDLNLQGTQFEWLLTAFYLTYISFTWLLMLYHILSPHIYIAVCVFFWGFLASCQSLTTSFYQLLILRLLLGVGEAAFSPGVPFYLSFFYRRDELAFRAALQLSAAPLASSFAGSLAYLIVWLGDKSPIQSWRLLFLAEGFPSIIIAIISWSFVADSPGTAWFLSRREQRIAQLRLRKEGDRIKAADEKTQAGKQNTPNRIDWHGVAQTLKDPKAYLTALMFLSCNIAFSSLPVFLPTILTSMGYTPLSSQALSAPPYLFATLVLLLTAYLSDRYRSRSPFILFHAALGSLSYGLIALGGYYHWPSLVRYIFVYPAAASFFSAIACIIAWTMNNQEGNTRKGVGMTILNIVGQLGPLIGTRLYPDSDAPFYLRGMVVCAIAMAVVGILALVLRVVFLRENENRAKEASGEGAEDGLLNQGRMLRKSERFVLML